MILDYRIDPIYFFSSNIPNYTGFYKPILCQTVRSVSNNEKNFSIYNCLFKMQMSKDTGKAVY